MKISRIKLENFKRFQTYEIFVKNNLTQDVADRLLILGDNGTGKTTILQAVALALSMVFGRTRQVSEFKWLGWVPGRYEEWGKPIIELDVHFTPDEIVATQEVAQEWYKNRQAAATEYVEPGDAERVTVRLEGGSYRVIGKTQGAKANVFQFRGRMYASQLLKSGANAHNARKWFARLPGAFWFDQYRNLAALPPVMDERDEQDATTGSHTVGVAQLRSYLTGWWLSSQLANKGTDTDWLMELENSYQRVFPGRSFSTPEPMFKGGVPTPEGYYFILSDGNRTYDIEEMSAGEQSVFPLLYEFVRMQIKNSVVLIDELDLNLHPPLAQALLAALPSIGPACQFLLTTHSEAISSMVSPAEIVRLPGGRLCL
ncbi:MAG: AAA family ATPase [Magnetococcales bacterium]|nr:AAA family ATPase [Magnetococcales bacterium]